MSPASSDLDLSLRMAPYKYAVEEALASYCRAMDEHDAEEAGRLLARCKLQFKDQEPLTGARSIRAFYAKVLRSGTPTRHVFSNLLIQHKEGNIAYAATYQRWSLGSDQPTCEGIGSYEGLFLPTPAGLSWTEHRVKST